MTRTPEDPLSECDREPIHCPASIQPHGALIVADADGICRHISANVEPVLGFAPAHGIGRPLRETIALPERWKTPADVHVDSPISLELAGRPLDAWLHSSGAYRILEFEPRRPSSGSCLHRRLAEAIAGLRAAPDFAVQHELTARFVSALTGFDRVMVYQFDRDWHGEVVGEHRNSPVESYLGHHFPASDIPAQARALYARTRLRLIPDVDFVPVPILPIPASPLDLSLSVLRSVSPVHIEYLRNMRVRASMSISLRVDGVLWGLIACHHRTTKNIPATIRAACELFGEAASLEIGHRQEAGLLDLRAKATRIQTRFFDVIAREQNVVDALIRYTPQLLEFLNAGGAAIRINKTTTRHGTTPDATQVESLLAWLEHQDVSPILATNTLSELHHEASAYRAKASGLLALRLSRVDSNYILWFRPEVLSTVTWAGRPEKRPSADGKIHPRKSFDAWTEIVHGRSLPWTEAEQGGALELLQAINALVLRRTERLLNENAELERKNIDLHSFAYIAAHDLKEPLRGISHYCAFFREDHGDALSAEALRKLGTIEGLVRNSEELIDTLNHYSQVGRMELARQCVEMDEIVDHVLEALSPSHPEVDFRRPQKLPPIMGDRVLLREVFLNLIGNAIRYNTNTEKWVEIGWRNGENQIPVFYVSDNGIGIPERHREAIFHIFRRLHAAGDFGGGTGAGLAIAKSIVERHGGRIWVESHPGIGSTFSFTLA